MLPKWLSDQITALRLSFMDSSLPGLKVICGFGSPIRRGIWFAVFMALIGLTFRDVTNLAVEFYKYPDSLNIKYEEPDGGKKMPMPAITVCNLNPYRWRNFCEKIDYLLDVGKKLVSNETHHSMIALNHMYCNKERMLIEERIPVWNLTESYMTMMQHFTEWSGALQRNYDTVQLMANLSHSVDNIVEMVTFDNGVLIHCNKSNSHPTAAEEEDCIKFDQRNPIPTEKMYARYGKCQCYFCTYTTDESQIARMDNFDGPHNGFQIVLQIREYDYLPFIVEAGFIIAVHDQGVEVDFTKDGVFIQPLATTFISVSRRHLQRLPEPYQNPCRDDWPPELKKVVEESNKYTAFECRDMCHQHTIMETLGCTALKYFILRVKNASEPDGYSDKRYKNCGPADSQRIKEIEEGIRTLTIDCGCRSVCEEVNFDKTTSSVSWHPLVQLSSMESEKRSTKAKVYVYMQSNLINNRTKVAKISTREFVSGIGSVMGMYLGYSFLLCWNIVDVVGRGAIETYRAFQRQKSFKLSVKRN